jgi:hypothetical protein
MTTTTHDVTGFKVRFCKVCGAGLRPRATCQTCPRCRDRDRAQMRRAGARVVVFTFPGPATPAPTDRAAS